MAEVNEQFLDDTGLSYLANRLGVIYQKQETGKGLSTNDYTAEDKAAVETIGDKVDKVDGKGLSTNDFTDEDKAAIDSIDDKVDKVEGKGLSTNDYSDADKAAVDSIDDKVNKEEGKGLSTNDYTTDDKTAVTNMNTTIDNKIAAALSDITGIDFNFDYSTYASLPRPGKSGIFYMIPHDGAVPNVYDEYVWYTKKVVTSDTSFGAGKTYYELVDGNYIVTEDETMDSSKTYYEDYSNYELIGTTQISLDGYWNTTNLTAITTARIDEILAS